MLREYAMCCMALMHMAHVLLHALLAMLAIFCMPFCLFRDDCALLTVLLDWECDSRGVRVCGEARPA